MQGAEREQVPAWFGPALAHGLAPLQRDIHNANAKVDNLQATRGEDALTPLHNLAGLAAPHFPATRDAIAVLTTAQCNGNFTPISSLLL